MTRLATALACTALIWLAPTRGHACSDAGVTDERAAGPWCIGAADSGCGTPSVCWTYDGGPSDAGAPARTASCSVSHDVTHGQRVLAALMIGALAAVRRRRGHRGRGEPIAHPEAQQRRLE